VEKAALPRNKVCSGMIMGRMAQGAMADTFGEIPVSVLAAPRYLEGYMIHYPGARKQPVRWKTPIGWRKDIDAWMVGKAVEAGVELWQETRVTGVVESESGYTVRVEQKGQARDVAARYLVGAEGADSTVRKSLFPDLEVRYVQNYRECHGDTKNNFDDNYFNAVFMPASGLSYAFAVHHKDGKVILETGAATGKVQQQREAVREYMASVFGFDAAAKPLWRDACVMALLLRGLIKGEFRPARNNALLVGDAAGLVMPLTGEGIGTALKSGLIAAEAVISAASSGSFAAGLFLTRLDAIIHLLDIMYTRVRSIDTGAMGAQYVADQLGQSWQATLEAS